MAKPKSSYNYDHDSDTTTITTIEKLNGQIITTTKTVEGNQIPQKSFIPTTTSGKIVLGFIVLSIISQILATVPQIIITPAALFGAIKLTKNKTKLEKTIAVTVAIVGSLAACSLFVKTPIPTTTSTYVDSKTRARQKLQDTYGNCYTLPNDQFVCPVK